MRTHGTDEERGLKLFRGQARREGRNALSKDQKALLFIIYYGKIAGAREISIDLLEPYVTWLEERLLERCALWKRGSKASILFFAQVVNYFSEHMNPNASKYDPEIRHFLEDRKANIDTIFGNGDGRGQDTALPQVDSEPQPSIQSQVQVTVRCIGLWAMMESVITEFDNEMKLNLYCDTYGGSVEDLRMGHFQITRFIEIANCSPGVDDWVDKIDPKEAIPAKKINAKLLKRIANMDFEWTFDAAKHLYSHDGRTLSIFCMPCRLQQAQGVSENSPQRALANMGFTTKYSAEILRSYELLFGPSCAKLLDDLVNDDAFPQPLDPQLRGLCNGSHSAYGSAVWQKDHFEHLWPRITYLQNHLGRIQPDGFWKLIYRDRRDSLSWYTFCFAVLVLVLTLLSTIASVIQATKAFYPSSVSGMVAQLNPKLSSTSLITVTTTRTKLSTVVITSSVASTLETGHLTTSAPLPVDTAPTASIALPKSSPGNDTGMIDQKGFVGESGGRGTVDIIWGCLFTIILCVTASLRINYPSTSEHTWQVWARSFRWFIVCLAAPELLMILATGQRQEARRSVNNWQSSGYFKWTLRHGFYANMGGIILRPRDSEPFPINSRQLHYLVTRGYVPYPKMIENDCNLDDVRYTMNMLKALALIQVVWFLTQFFARVSFSLTLTTLELITIPYVLCTLATGYFWLHKPIFSQKHPTTLISEMDTGEILLSAGSVARKPYSQTPLDFIDDLSPSWLTDIQPHLHFRMGPRVRPLQRFTNDRFPIWSFGSVESLVQAVIHVVYSAIPLIAWNFTFPTFQEQGLWRLSSLALVSLTIAIYLSEIYKDAQRTGLWNLWLLILFPRSSSHISRISTMDHRRREKDVFPPWQALYLLVVGVPYLAARAYMGIEVFLSLRSLSSSAFETVTWVDFIPHY